MGGIKLTEVKAGDEAILYKLLAERPNYANISHKEMPTLQEHCSFVNHYICRDDHTPSFYTVWYLILKGDEAIGSIYLTRKDEIGIHLLTKHRGKRYGNNAVHQLMLTHPRDKYYANVAPGNKNSQKFFENLGFEHIQNTYVLESK